MTCSRLERSTEPSPGARAASALGLAHTVLEYGQVTSVAEAAVARGVEVADERICGRRITLGSGRHGVAIALAADDLITTFSARVADVTTSAAGD